MQKRLHANPAKGEDEEEATVLDEVAGHEASEERRHTDEEAERFDTARAVGRIWREMRARGGRRMGTDSSPVFF